MNTIVGMMILSAKGDIKLPIMKHEMATMNTNRLIIKFKVADLSKTWFIFSIVSSISSNMLKLENKIRNRLTYAIPF